MARRTFFSFHYKPDNSRAAQVRNMGMVDGNKPVSDNDWEAITKGGDAKIKKWIADQLYGRSCTVVLVGSNTAGRKWINYEIVESWNRGMGVVGIHIYGLKNFDGQTAIRGSNPFANIAYANSGRKLSSIVSATSPLAATAKNDTPGSKSTWPMLSKRRSRYGMATERSNHPCPRNARFSS